MYAPSGSYLFLQKSKIKETLIIFEGGEKHKEKKGIFAF